MSTLRPLRELVDNVSDAFNPAPTSSKEFLLFSFEAFDAGKKPVTVAESEMKSGKKIVRAGDVLFAKLNPRIPRAWLVRNSGNGTTKLCSTEFVVLRVKKAKELDPEYLTWTLLAPQFLAPIQAQVSSSTKSHQRVRPEFILDKGIPLPPHLEQRRVVSRIKECLSRVEEMQRLREEALDDASALTAAAVRERLDPLVRAGDLIPFGELVAATRLGLVRSKGEQGDGRAFAYFKMNNIARGGRVDVTSMTRVDATPQEARENALTDGDFLFNTRNSFELVGKTGVAPAFPEPLLYNNNILRVRFRDGVLSHYVNFAFQHPFVQKELNLRKSKTTNVCAVYYKSLQTLPIPFPKRADDQKEITTFLKRVESTAIAMESQLDEQESDYPALRESILREAFAGNL